MTDGRVVLVTAPDRETARELVRTLVEEGLVACGNIVPGVSSIYRWEGEIHEDEECLVLLKTREGALPNLMERVVVLHSYDVPEVLALPVDAAHPPYLDWVRRSTSARP